MKFHHIGIVVQKLSKSSNEVRNILPVQQSVSPENIVSQKVNVSFLKIGDIFFEFIEPIDNTSPIYNFSEKGGGIHHVCFEVDDIHKSVKDFQEKGARIVVEPVRGFEERLIAFVFLNLSNTKFNLIELAEKK